MESGQSGRWAHVVQGRNVHVSTVDTVARAPMPWSVPGRLSYLCSEARDRGWKDSGAQIKNEGLSNALCEIVKEMQRAHREQIAELCRQFTESINHLVQNPNQKRKGHCQKVLLGPKSIRSPKTHPCFICHRLGHWKRECPSNRRNRNKDSSKSHGHSRPSPQIHPCSKCSQLGHWRVNCPQRNGTGQGVGHSCHGNDSVRANGHHRGFGQRKPRGKGLSRSNAGVTAPLVPPGKVDGQTPRSPHNPARVNARRRVTCRPGGLPPPSFTVPGYVSNSSNSEDDEGGVVANGEPQLAGDVIDGELHLHDNAEGADLVPVAQQEDGPPPDDLAQQEGVGVDDVNELAASNDDGSDTSNTADSDSGSNAPNTPEDPPIDGDDSGDQASDSSGEDAVDDSNTPTPAGVPPDDGGNVDVDEEASETGPRRSGRSSRPPDRYGSYVYRISALNYRTDADFLCNKLVRDSDTEVFCNQLSPLNRQKYVDILYVPCKSGGHNCTGIPEKSPAKAGQVSPPLTEEQWGVYEGCKALDM